MTELKILWQRIERQVIYLVLFSFFLLQFLSIFSPQLATFMSARGSLMMIALVLLTIFRFLDAKLNDKDQVGLKASSGFVQEIVNLLKEKQKHKSVEIFASTAGLYYPAIRESRVKIEHLKILLRDPNDLDAMKFPLAEEQKKQIAFRVQGVMHDFKGLQSRGQISNLSIGFYTFQPTFHCMIVDDKCLYFGFYGITSDQPGPEFTYVARKNTVEGFSLLSDFKTEFNNFWSVYGQSPTK